MSSESIAIELNQSLTEGMSAVERWAYIEAQIKNEVDRVLKAHGFTRRKFSELETEAILTMPIDQQVTHFGTVLKHYIADTGVCDRLILMRKDEKP